MSLLKLGLMLLVYRHKTQVCIMHEEEVPTNHNLIDYRGDIMGYSQW